jgi:magnesium transporter
VTDTEQAIPKLRRRAGPGAPPGTLVADPAAGSPTISVIAYGPDGMHEHDNCSVTDIDAMRSRGRVLWVNVTGLRDVALIQAVGEHFGLHGLALEDVINVHQRPKTEAYDDHLFLVTLMPAADRPERTEQLSLFLGQDYLLTFQERPGDSFDAVRDRLRRGKGRVRSAGADYLAYSLLDAVIDSFFPVLEGLGEELEGLEAEVLRTPDSSVVSDLHGLKRDLLSVRRAIWPQREMLNALIRGESELIGEVTSLYLRDCYDHTIQLMDIVETYREIASGLVDVYLSNVSARLNEIMKVLTVIATIFIPLGFIASVYGMNFDRAVSAWNMPELGWRFGYPFSLLLMVGTAAGLLLFFRRKGWLGGVSPKRRRLRRERREESV